MWTSIFKQEMCFDWCFIQETLSDEFSEALRMLHDFKNFKEFAVKIVNPLETEGYDDKLYTLMIHTPLSVTRERSFRL